MQCPLAPLGAGSQHHVGFAAPPTLEMDPQLGGKLLAPEWAAVMEQQGLSATAGKIALP